ncbi:tRNA intron endonuclease [Thamnocephalis sphaerospora]|uniref:tRNA-intron lyase n=1 Tax=Thamnocephalis sphaerospora TaxID=78915 RepID=A0A4P9XNJ5_9FUNG|nr:tRNA intron endonuclease [Thamnocephalis sphaerospora]|eukprot:RKP07528.1 tRNA intron endonuclease [Thamnocephalis sphaerospora]
MQGSTVTRASGLSTEPLWLSPEEVVFLAWGLGCLRVVDAELGIELDISEIWQRSCCAYSPRTMHADLGKACLEQTQSNDRFALRYAAYHHLRSHRWVVRDGIKYGTDFVIYEQGPLFDHATHDIASGLYPENVDWPGLLGIVRVCNQVRKTLRICYVGAPSGTRAGTDGPWCIGNYTVGEFVLRRWVPERDRV